MQKWIFCHFWNSKKCVFVLLKVSKNLILYFWKWIFFWNFNSLCEVETAEMLTVDEVNGVFSRNFLLELLPDPDLFGHCFRGRLIKVRTSWPVSGSNFRRFLAPLRRPRLLFLRLPPPHNDLKRGKKCNFSPKILFFF